MVVRLNGDGSPDTGFDDNSTLPAVSTVGEVAGGKLLIGGADGDEVMLLRLNADGTPDSAFNGGQPASAAFASAQSLRNLAIDDDGNIYAISGIGALAVARFTPAGAFDDDFGRLVGGNFGVSVFTRGGGLEPNGNLVVVGQENLFPPGEPVRRQILLTRILADDDGNPSPVRLDGNLLRAEGTSGNDVIEVHQGAAQVHVTRDNFGRAFDVADFDHVAVSAGAGDDQVSFFAQTVRGDVSGGDGRDKLTGGDANDTLRGNASRDFIDGGLGADLISGNGAADQIRGQGGADHLYGGAGDDYVEGGGRNDRIDGGAGSDVLRGSAGDDVFAAADGEIDQLLGDGDSDTSFADPDDELTSIESPN
jgi:Ca2+-binding RTX toxin-like protein